MKKTLNLCVLFAGLLLIASCAGSEKKEGSAVASDSASIDTTLFSYACPMDTDVISKTPGTCSKCGMELEKVALAKSN